MARVINSRFVCRECGKTVRAFELLPDWARDHDCDGEPVPLICPTCSNTTFEAVADKVV